MNSVPKVISSKDLSPYINLEFAFKQSALTWVSFSTQESLLLLIKFQKYSIQL